MEILRPWIVPLVEATLCSSLGQPLPDELVLRNPLKLVDDDSNLRVLVRDQKIAQVAQWSPDPGPIRGTLSDSVTTISSIFSKDSTERYRNKTRKQVNKGTKGALIKINEFEIVISYVRARKPDITLYILDFRVEGCEGSGVFGKPVDINFHSGISSMAKKCSRKYNSQRNDHASPNREARKMNASSDSDSDSDAASLKSQACDSNSPLGSKDQFKSQVLYYQGMEKTRAPPRNFTALPKKNATLLLSALTSKPGPAGPSEPISTGREKLGEQRKIHTPLSPEVHVDIDQIGFATQLPLSIEKAPSMQEKINSNDDGGAELLAQSNSPVDRTPRRRISDTRLSHNLSKNHEKKTMICDDQRKDIDYSQMATGGIIMQQTQPAMATRISRDKPVDNHVSRSSLETPKPTTTKNRAMPTNSPKTNKAADRDDPWRHMTRIRRRDVKVPKDQEELISKKESWVPPEPGKQVPQAHVPIHLLQEWNEMHRCRPSTEKCSASPAPSPSPPPPPPQSTNEEDELDADLLKSSPESELSESEWPATLRSPCSSHLVPQDSSPPHSGNTRPSRLSYATNVLNNEGRVAGETENDPECGADISRNLHGTPTLDTTTPMEDEDNESEMEIVVPNALSNVNQSDGEIEDDAVASSGTSPSPANKISFTEVEQTPYVEGGKRRMPTSSHCLNVDRDSTQKYNKVSSDSLIPSTYDSRRLNVHPESSASTNGETSKSSAHNSRRASKELNLLDCSSTDDDEFMAERQLVSDLDEHTQSTHWEYLTVPNTVHAPGTPIDADKPLSSSVDPLKSQIEMNATSPITKKRKRHEISPKGGNRTEHPKTSKSQKSRHNTFSYMAKPTDYRSIRSERRQSYFGNDVFLSKTEVVYNRFKETYPDYTGSLDHFKQACCKLQCLRDQKSMERSFLWDDFIVRYPAHILQYREPGNISPTVSYENYFHKEVTKPQCRKRNLTARDLELILAEREHKDKSSPMPNYNRRSFRSSFPADDQAATSQVNPVIHGLSSSYEVDHSREPSIPESNHEGLLSSLQTNLVEDVTESSDDELEAHETASVELGGPRTASPLSVSAQEIPFTDEDVGSGNEDNMMSDGIAESVQGGTCSPGTLATAKQARNMPLEIDSDDYSGILESSPSNSSFHEGNHEGSRGAHHKIPEKVDTSEILPNEHNPGLLKSQDKNISPPPKSRLPHRPPDSRQNPFWNLYNKTRKQLSEVKDPKDPDDPKPWYKSPNTPFKIFARNLAKLQADYGFRRDGSKADPIPVDEDGVVRPPPLGDPRGMDSMGWKL
ncbi:hypothetical protein ACJ72_04779 [Emergomyces africanus]|uniref:Shelterin complex subunit TPP1/Est3 domain-containing protein n=1 Tax=Emergomyces africanus TaxID=1955775 RepID=A0A1B7NVU7_9EURO|nr:hypothetical protein ACJ72_04779 [Emergomyces africanus]